LGSGTNVGVRYREHETRKHGVRADRYFSVRYKLDGKDKEEGRARDGITFKDYFDREYLPVARVTKKPESIRKTEEHVKNWLGPVSVACHSKISAGCTCQRCYLPGGCRPVAALHSVRLRHLQGHLEPCPQHRVRPGAKPTKGVALPKVNNERKRYLTRAEADALLTELAERSPHV
jgi:hypothetical protein